MILYADLQKEQKTELKEKKETEGITITLKK